MIIEGAAAGNVSWWSKHLLRTDTNEKVTIKDIRGLTADDLPSALREMQALASGSRCRGNFMYQANINPLAHEHLTNDQWNEAVDLLEKNLGLEGHQRVVVEHVKNGREHRHVIWNRVDPENLRVTDIGGNYYTHERTARELERRFELERTPRTHGEREGPRPERPLQLWEIQRGERSGVDPHALKAELTQLWRATDSGKAFAAALEARGYILAKGDRRDFCVIDRAAHEHSLTRRLEGVKAKDVRERMADIDREALPSVEAAKELQRQRIRNLRESARADNQSDGPPTISLSPATGLASNVAGKVLDALADAFTSMVVPTTPEERQAAQDAEQRAADALPSVSREEREARELRLRLEAQLEDQLRDDIEHHRTLDDDGGGRERER
jgi:hypothetical protein